MAKLFRDPRMKNAAGTPAWVVTYKGLDGKRHRERLDATTLHEAKLLMARLISEQAKAEGRGFNSVDSMRLITLKEYAERTYLPFAEQHVKASSFLKYKACGESVFKILGDKPIQHIRAADIREFIVKRKARKTRKGTPPTGSTINRELSFLSACLQQALSDDLIPANPVRAIKALKENKRTRWLNPDEVQTLLETIDASSATWLRPLVVIAVNTGMRLGEILALTRAEADADQLRVTSTTAKNSKERFVKVTPPIREALQQAKKYSLAIGADGARTSLFVYGDRGVDNAFRRVVKSAGFQTEGEDRVTFHTLRHTACSWMVQEGVKDRKIMAQLGHGSSQMVSRYAHLAPEALDEPADALASKWSSVRPVAQDGELVAKELVEAS